MSNYWIVAAISNTTTSIMLSALCSLGACETQTRVLRSEYRGGPKRWVGEFSQKRKTEGNS